MEIIEGTDTGSITDRKAGNNCMQMILFEVSGESGVGSYFKFDGDKKRPKHIGRKPGFGSKVRITVPHKGIHVR